MLKPVHRRLIAAGVIFLIGFAVFASGLLRPLDHMIADRVYQSARLIDNNIKIIAIDEKTLAALGPMANWSRQVYADLVDTLNTEESAPAAIGFDIMFIGNVSEPGDENFAQSARAYGNVCVAANVVFNDRLVMDGDGVYLDAMSADMLELPYPALLDATQYGFANMASEQDGIVRSSVLTTRFGGETLYSFPAVCYMAYADALGIKPAFPHTDPYSRWWIPYAGYPGDYEAVSLIDVLNGTVDPRLFGDTLVLVGAYAPGLQDAYNVPIDKAEQMYGVEIHANIIQALLDGAAALPADPVASALIFAACAALLYLAFMRIKRALVSVLLLAAVIAANAALGMLLYQNGWIVNLICFPLAAIAVYVAALVSSYLFERAHRKKVVEAFKKYVAPQVVEELVREGRYDIVLGGENRDIAVMFVDIRGFTPLSERLKPEDVVSILNAYLNLTTEAIFTNGGTLDKFIGDATMAIFNAPFDLDGYALCAAITALDIVSGAHALAAEIELRYHETVSFGIGLHCGEAVVGNIGCASRMDYTAIGDTVNTAARLESNAGRSQILMSEVFYRRLEAQVLAKEIGTMPLKGKTSEINVYELLGMKTDESLDDHTVS